MSSHWSLVAFTLLIQSAAGSVWCMQAASILQSGPRSADFLRVHAFTALVAALVGLAAAVGHLGHPLAGFHAIRNLKSSWLSRESVAVSIFAGVLVVIAVLSLSRSGSVFDDVLPLGSLAAAVALYAMIHVYRLRTVPSWNHTGTPLNYLGSALLLGGLLFLLVSIIHPQATHAGLTVIEKPSCGNIGLFAIVAGYLLKIAASLVAPSADMNVVKGLRISAMLAQVLGGVALIALLGSTEVSTNLQRTFLLLATAGLVTGEILQRIRFYAAYQRIGL